MVSLFSALAGALLASSTLAHMQLHYPAPFNASNNPHRTTAADPYLQYPYDCCGPNNRWEYPCRGYLSLLGTPKGTPTATWEVGSAQTWNITGIGNHYGGSCQVGFSKDKGDTFRVARSYEGNCPHRNGGLGPKGQDFYFFVPDDLETGVQVFAWIWYNREQEFNMNCAAINITARTSSPDYPPASVSMSRSAKSCDDAKATDVQASRAEQTSVLAFVPAPTRGSLGLLKTSNGCSCECTTPYQIQTCECFCHQDDGHSMHSRAQPSHRHMRRHSTSTSSDTSSPAAVPSSQYVPFNKRPLMFIADDGNECLTPKTTAELKYPHPGPNAVPGDGEYPLELPSGNCDRVGGQAYDGANGNDGHP